MSERRNNVPMREFDNEPVVPQLPNPVPQNRFLQDLDGWLESHGLRSAEDVPDFGETASTTEERRRVKEEVQYVQSVHNVAFRDSIEQEAHERIERRAFISALHGRTMDIHTSENDCIRNIPLDRMAQMCDTIYVMAKNKSWHTNELSGGHAARDDRSFHLSLKSYAKSSVQEFVNVVLSYVPSDTPCSDEEYGPAGSIPTWVATAADRISNDALFDCCHIAHYLMAESIVNAITYVFFRSIDTENCFMIYQLADELSLSSALKERALVHMMDTIGDVDRNNNAWEEDTYVWSKEWKERILLLKRAMESSSCHHRRLYFSSIEEYLSIFAERVQYYQERLAEAKECQRMSHPRSVGSHGWLDAQRKIEQQEQRVRTLEMALAEQKKLFRASKFCRRE